MANLDYKKIIDLQARDWNVNIFGVVKYFCLPLKINKTGQYHMMITIIDESVEENIEDGIRCNLFDYEGKLPEVKKVGDIILLKKVKVKLFDQRLQVQRTNSYQWVVFGTEENNRKYYSNTKSSSQPPPCITYYDRKRLCQLLQFLGRVKSKIIESENIIIDESDFKITLLSDIKSNIYINIVVQVIAVNEFENPSCKSLLLKVSDGTKVFYNSWYQVGKVKVTEANDIEKATREFSCDISVFDEHVDEVEKFKVGDFILITNLHVKSVSKALVQKSEEEFKIQQIDGVTDWNELIIHSGGNYGRGIKVAVNDDPRVISVIKRIAQATNSYYVKMVIDDILQIVVEKVDDQSNFSENPSVAKRSHLDEQPPVQEQPNLNEQPRCLQESLTSTDFPLKPFTSISSIKWCKEGGNKFRLRAKVVSIRPTNLKDIIIGKCGKCDEFSKSVTEPCNDIPMQCPLCKDGSLNLTYLFRLLLEDETGLIQVIAYGDEALYFFMNTSPIALLREQTLMSDFDDKLSKFDNYKDDLDTSTLPSIDICVFTCETNSGLKYRLFGTSLL